MNEIVCKGLSAGWINSWLAAVGATVLDSRILLHWTQDDMPVAVLSAHGIEPVTALIDSWPDKEMLSKLPTKQKWQSPSGQHKKEDVGTLGRHVKVEDFRKRARAARGRPYSWTLTSTMTDLCIQNGEVEHALFDPAGPGTIKDLYHRLVKAHSQVESPAEWIAASLAGYGTRVVDNGLGFDVTRLGSQADNTHKLTDPVIEVLAFFGLALLTVRGDGVGETTKTYNRGNKARQKGWKRPKPDETLRFRWPAWNHSLDMDGIAAMLDIFWKLGSNYREGWAKGLGIHAAWRTVAFKPGASSDKTRAFGAELWKPQNDSVNRPKNHPTKQKSSGAKRL